MDTFGSLRFLNPLVEYKTQKPYSIDYRIQSWESNIPRSNYKSLAIDQIPITDIRGKEDQFTFNKNGFAIIELDSAMQYEDFDDPGKIDALYCEEIASCLLRYFPNAAAVQIYDVEVSSKVLGRLDIHSVSRSAADILYSPELKCNREWCRSQLSEYTLVSRPVQLTHRTSEPQVADPADGTRKSCYEVVDELGDAARQFKDHLFLKYFPAKSYSC